MWIMTFFAGFAVLVFSCGPVFARNFAPTPLKLSAPSNIGYNSDNPEVEFPVTVSGVPATVMFAVFTHGRAGKTADMRGGNLGWHYVNRVDTCVYVSGPHFFRIGQNTLSWNIRDKNGYHFPFGDYAYFLWGYDSTSPGMKVTNSISSGRFANAYIQTADERGPLYRPRIFDSLPLADASSGTVRVVRGKWEIGNDPDDPTFLETTAYSTCGEAPGLTLNATDPGFFYTESIRPGSLVFKKWRWVPNDTAILETVWGDRGELHFPTGLPSTQPLNGGPVTDGGFLLFTNAWEEMSWHSGVVCADIEDGTPLRTIDLTQWWSGSPDAVYGPINLELAHNGQGSFLFCTSPVSCVYQMIAPFAENEADIVRWVNGNGDGFGDKNYSPGSPRPWMCNDVAVPPYPPSLSADANLFSLFAATGLSAASFGTFAPDGSGLGYFTIPGMEDGAVRALHVIDTGGNYISEFDGIYFGGVDAKGDSTGIRYIACDSVKGVFSNFADSFGLIRIYNPYAGDVLTAGSKRYITWDGDVPSVCRIEFSADGGATWSVIADSIESIKGVYLWTAPPVSSNRCRIRFMDSTGIDNTSFTSGEFTITGVAGVEDGTDTAPRALTVSNSPNPFNPSTVIAFTLPAAGTVRLAVYDITGRKVADLAHGFHSMGKHSVVWNASGCASGVYFCVLKAGNAVETRKMLLMR